MKAKEFITELRRNPERNPKASPYERVVQRAESAPNNTFVSMTAIDKLGINPESKYNTPIGIYSYPAEFVTKVAAKSLRDLPFAGSAPFANIFNARGNVVDVSAMTENEYQQWANKASDIFANLYKKKMTSKHQDANRAWKVGADIANETIEHAPMMAKFGSPGGKFWYVVMNLSRRLIGEQLVNSSNEPMVWNSLFRMLGIDGCVDHGRGIIHTSERNQAVFFHIGAITNVERVHNKWDQVSQIEALDKKIAGLAKATVAKFLKSNPKRLNSFIYEYLTSRQNSPKPVLDELAAQLEASMRSVAPTWEPSYQGIISDTFGDIGASGTWDMISQVDGVSNKEKYQIITTWRAYVAGGELLINNFRTPEFITYLKELALSNPDDKRTSNFITRLLAQERVLSGPSFYELVDADSISDHTKEGVASYVTWEASDTARIKKDAINGEKYALEALNISTILTDDDYADLFATEDVQIIQILNRRPGHARQAVGAAVIYYVAGTIADKPRIKLAFTNLSRLAQREALGLLDMVVKRNPGFAELQDFVLKSLE